MQAMVFGNMGNDCATGVAFTRDPSTGSNEFYGEFLVNAQGEDVVAGIRTPQELTIKARKSHGSDLPSLEEVMPNIFKQLLSVRSQLETHYKDSQRPKSHRPLKQKQGSFKNHQWIPGHARYRVHDSTRQALHVADSQRQAHGPGCAADCR